ncbi:hypothetical protein [Daejeonella oryzae]|uniref:hypothetical protein n=1 Tax=Daejeonella oryzae TaxID=1122943 RepID=UPI0006871067|nr:hypothetical protein [Daejeonella oryzae]
MNRTFKIFLIAVAFTGKAFSQHNQTVDKTSQEVTDEPEKSPIKSLSLSEYNAYKHGKGMGLAKPAELNSYPGPMHVLDLEKELKLSALQKTHLTAAIEAMKFKALEMAGFILAEEKKINELFASGKANEGSIIYYTNKIGLYQAELRNAHLQAHLKARRILSPDQIKKYNRIRGYSN